jgi:uncharacterized protein (TIGR03086 family)
VSAERFRRVARRYTDLAVAVTAGAWDNASPCAGWVARDIVRHLTEWIPAFLTQADVTFPSGPSVDEDPVAAWTTVADHLQTLLDDATAASREFEAGPPGRMTLESAISMLMVGDIVIHTWDLARATALDETLDPDIVSEMLVGMQPLDDMLRGSGHYGPKVHVGDDADDQTKLIAFTGRVP